MPRAYSGPKLWLDPQRGTWTIVDGRKRVRTGYPELERDRAVLAVHEYSNGRYRPYARPTGPVPPYLANPRKGVYVIGFGPYVKIGVTVNLTERLRNLQTPEPIILYALLDGFVAKERELHQRFAAYRLNGEWFRKEGELAAWIDGGCQ